MEKRVKVAYEPLTDEFSINGYQVGRRVLAAMLTANERVLWRFEMVDGELEAIPYYENEVIWLDKKRYA